MVSVSYLIKANRPSFRHHSILVFICLPCVLPSLRYLLTCRQTSANPAQLWSSLDTRPTGKEKREEVEDGPHDQPRQLPTRSSALPGSQQRPAPVRTGVGMGSQWGAGFLPRAQHPLVPAPVPLVPSHRVPSPHEVAEASSAIIPVAVCSGHVDLALQPHV